MRYEQVGERWIIRIMDNGAAALVDKARNVVWGGGVPGWVTMRDGERMTIGAGGTDQRRCGLCRV